MQSRIRRVHACLTVTCCQLHFWQNGPDLSCATAITRWWIEYWNKSQHRKLTLEKKILLLGLEPTSFRSQSGAVTTELSMLLMCFCLCGIEHFLYKQTWWSIFPSVCVCVSVSVCLCVWVYMHLCIRLREGEGEFIYIYLEREWDREREFIYRYLFSNKIIYQWAWKHINYCDTNSWVLSV